MVKKEGKDTEASETLQFQSGEVVGVRLGGDVVRGVVVEDRGIFGPGRNHVVRISVQVTGSTTTTLEVLSTSLTAPPPSEKPSSPPAKPTQ